ncbi:hypothetical protein [Cupriavidus campinensis]
MKAWLKRQVENEERFQTTLLVCGTTIAVLAFVMIQLAVHFPHLLLLR